MAWLSGVGGFEFDESLYQEFLANARRLGGEQLTPPPTWIAADGRDIAFELELHNSLFDRPITCLKPDLRSAG